MSPSTKLDPVTKGSNATLTLDGLGDVVGDTVVDGDRDADTDVLADKLRVRLAVAAALLDGDGGAT